MQFIDLHRQYEELRDSINQRINAVLERTEFIQGAEVKELEECLAAYTGRKFVRSCASGTDALTIALTAFGVIYFFCLCREHRISRRNSCICRLQGRYL